MKKIFVLLADGFEEAEALVPTDYLRRADFDVQLVSTTGSRRVVGARDISVNADTQLADVQPSDSAAVVIPGGAPGARSLRDNDAVIDFVRTVYEAGDLVAAICAGPIVLARAGIMAGKNATCFPGWQEEADIVDRQNGVIRDGNVITASGPAFAPHLAYEIIRYFDESRLADLQEAVLQQDLAQYLASQ